MTAENDDDNDNQQAEGSQLPESPPRTGLPRRTASSYSDSGDSQDVTTLNQLEYCVYGRATTTDWNEDDDDEEDWSQTPTPQPHHTIDVKYLRKLASRGIPDEGSQRGVVWRLLLNYLPDQTDEWSAQLQASRAFYHQCVTDLMADTYDVQHGDALRWRPRRGPGSGWTVPSNNNREEDSVENIVTNDTAKASEEELGEQQQDDGSLSDVDLPKPPPTETPLERPPPVTPELPDSIRQAWKARGKDEHLLNNLASSYNALKVKTGPDTSPNDAEDYVEAAVLLDEVRKDVHRTHPDLSFFLEPTFDLGARRYAAIERILFVWATYNKGVRYVQGMNEIVGAIYYVLAKDWNPEWAAHAEADSYFLFATLLAEMRDVFISDMDDSATGIQGRLAHMQTLLQMHDPEVEEHLDEVGVDVSYYAVRWWTTLLSREFLLPDTIRLWDSMFASTHKDNFMRYVCVTMVLVIRDKILKGDFATCIKLLQGYPPTHMDNLIEASRALWIYETQVNLAIHKGGYTRHMALQSIKPPPAIIMAFGFRRGVAPKTRQEMLEEASGKAADRARDAASKVATSARSYFGKANGILNKYMQQYKGSSSVMDSEEEAQLSQGIEEVRFSEEKLKVRSFLSLMCVIIVSAFRSSLLTLCPLP